MAKIKHNPGYCWVLKKECPYRGMMPWDIQKCEFHKESFCSFRDWFVAMLWNWTPYTGSFVNTKCKNMVVEKRMRLTEEA